ncbi:MAG: hypothetical protein JO202_11545 [Ktedonobacteraceae bacterium]|nr:hypothetical protein [Ktedonobacteraceae bacterium]
MKLSKGMLSTCLIQGKMKLKYLHLQNNQTALEAVEWVGEHQIHVQGLEQGSGSGEIEIIPDRNDAATFLLAATLGHGPVTLHPVRQEHLRPLVETLKRVGVRFEEEGVHIE